jgi:hypothetical protein
MIMDAEQKEEVTTEDYETNSDSEGEATEGYSETGDSNRTYTQAELDARIKEQDKRWKDRLKDSKKGDKKGSEESNEEVDERYQRLELKTEGITSTKEQDVILDYAKYKGIDPTEAMKSPAIRAELAELRSKNVPAPSTRTSGGKSDSYDYYAKNIKAGKIRLG